MKATATQQLKPRKTPRQARSEATVAAIYEAAIQVSLAEGLARMTTTRIAERAGVSVGTLYQYFPNKNALLHALLERHLDSVATQVEQACAQSVRDGVEPTLARVVHAYVSAKTARIDETRLLYQVYAELNAAEVVINASDRISSALMNVLAQVPDARFDDLPMTVFMLRGALSGITRAYLESGVARGQRDALIAQTTTLCLTYVREVAHSVHVAMT